MNDDQLHERLEAVGSERVDDPDELVLAGIERRLIAGHTSIGGARRRRPVLWPVIVGVVATVALVVGFVRNEPEPAPLDTVGVEGTFGPPSTTTTTTTAPPAPAVNTPPTTEPDEPNDEQSVGSTPVTTVPPDDARPPAPPDSTATTVFRSPPETAPPEDGPRPPPDTRPPPDQPRPIRAAVQWREERALVSWDDPVRDDVVTWSIVREVRLEPDGPDARRRILVDGPRPQRRFVDDPPARGRVAYIVAGHRADGEVIVRSDRLVLPR